MHCRQKSLYVKWSTNRKWHWNPEIMSKHWVIYINYTSEWIHRCKEMRTHFLKSDTSNSIITSNGSNITGSIALLIHIVTFHQLSPECHYLQPTTKDYIIFAILHVGGHAQNLCSHPRWPRNIRDVCNKNTQFMITNFLSPQQNVFSFCGLVGKSCCNK